jgi:hypothetical protein
MSDDLYQNYKELFIRVRGIMQAAIGRVDDWELKNYQSGNPYPDYGILVGAVWRAAREILAFFPDAPPLPREPENVHAAAAARNAVGEVTAWLDGLEHGILDPTSDMAGKQNDKRPSAVKGRVRPESERRILEQMAIAQLCAIGPILSRIASSTVTVFHGRLY